MDGTGLIEFHDFVRFTMRLLTRQGDTEEEALEIFRRFNSIRSRKTYFESFLFRFDIEKTGKIPVDEIKFILKNLPVKVSEEDIDTMIKEVDKDGNGEIDLKEFKSMIGF